MALQLPSIIMQMFRTALLFALLSASVWAADCPCDPAKPETLQLRQCSLCAEAEKHASDVPFFFLRDNNPRKPNRWLLLPRRHWDGLHELADMSQSERTALWTAAIGKAKELWGPGWGVAYNGAEVRTQCHLHIHIGKLLQGVELDRNFVVISKPSQIPVIRGEGMWIHPVGNKLHVHQHEQRAEPVLLR